MDDRSKEMLEEIRVKSVEELRDHEIRFLKARRSYLTLDDKDKFKSILIEPKEPKKKETPKAPIEQTLYKDLQAQAKAKGIKYVGVSRVDLENSLN